MKMNVSIVGLCTIIVVSVVGCLPNNADKNVTVDSSSDASLSDDASSLVYDESSEVRENSSVEQGLSSEEGESSDSQDDLPQTVVYTEGYSIKVKEGENDRNYIIKGVCWSPYDVGDAPHSGQLPQYREWASKDAAQMKAAHINTVRTYMPFKRTDTWRAVLDTLHSYGIKIIMTVYANHRWDKESTAINTVKYFRDHPAILMWMVGNEINNNNLYNEEDFGLDRAIAITNDMVEQIKAVDNNHPVVVSWGGPWEGYDVLNQLKGDVLSFQVYANDSFHNLFDDHLKESDKPLMMSEYGTDSFNRLIMAEDEEAQAYAIAATTREIRDNLSATNSGSGVLIGGTVFEWNDEWWKYSGAGEFEGWNTQDTNTTWESESGWGPWPDLVWNEEFFGVVDVDRNPKPAYDSLKSVYGTY
ncbi:MAG: hypothetical protein OCD01_07145 [Fibrobacterales bacterium]